MENLVKRRGKKEDLGWGGRCIVFFFFVCVKMCVFLFLNFVYVKF